MDINKLKRLCSDLNNVDYDDLQLIARDSGIIVKPTATKQELCKVLTSSIISPPLKDPLSQRENKCYKCSLDLFNSIAKMISGKRPFDFFRQKLDSAWKFGFMTPTLHQQMKEYVKGQEQMYLRLIDMVNTRGEFIEKSSSNKGPKKIRNVQDWTDAIGELIAFVGLMKDQADSLTRKPLNEYDEEILSKWCKEQNQCGPPCTQIIKKKGPFWKRRESEECGIVRKL